MRGKRRILLSKLGRVLRVSVKCRGNPEGPLQHESAAKATAAPDSSSQS